MRTEWFWSLGLSTIEGYTHNSEKFIPFVDFSQKVPNFRVIFMLKFNCKVNDFLVYEAIWVFLLDNL